MDTTKISKQKESDANGLLIEGSMAKKNRANHSKLIGVKGDLQTLKKYLKTLDTTQLVSIAFALDYIKTCIPTGDTLAEDSVFACFRNEFYYITNAFSDSAESKYQSVLQRIYVSDSTSPAVKAFQDNLNYCGIKLYANLVDGNEWDIEPDYFYRNFKDRVSKGMNAFLSLRSAEMKEGFSEDAGLLISFEDLYKRVKNWEKFEIAYPNNIYVKEADYYYVTYLCTLLTGMDNSRVFDLETNIITPEMKDLFNKIMKDDPGSRTTKIVTEYYNMLAKNKFVGDEEQLNKFLKEHNLVSMLGVEPIQR